MLEAMGQQLVSITKQAFSNESLRPAAWPAVTGLSMLDLSLQQSNFVAGESK